MADFGYQGSVFQGVPNNGLAAGISQAGQAIGAGVGQYAERAIVSNALANAKGPDGNIDYVKAASNLASSGHLDAANKIATTYLALNPPLQYIPSLNATFQPRSGEVKTLGGTGGVNPDAALGTPEQNKNNSGYQTAATANDELNKVNPSAHGGIQDVLSKAAGEDNIIGSAARMMISPERATEDDAGTRFIMGLHDGVLPRPAQLAVERRTFVPLTNDPTEIATKAAARDAALKAKHSQSGFLSPTHQPAAAPPGQQQAGAVPKPNGVDDATLRAQAIATIQAHPEAKAAVIKRLQDWGVMQANVGQ